MYDMSCVMGYGVGDGKDCYIIVDCCVVLCYLNVQCWKDVVNGIFVFGGYDIYVDDKGNVSVVDCILLEILFVNFNLVLKEFFDYYCMLCGFYLCLVNLIGVWNVMMLLLFMNMLLLSYVSEVIILMFIVIGEKVYLCYFVEDVFKVIGSKEKVLVIVSGVNYVDFYDNVVGKIFFVMFV